MQIQKMLGAIHKLERHLSDSFAEVSDRHQREPDVRETCKKLATWSRGHLDAMAPMLKRYGEDETEEPDRLRSALFHGTRIGAMGLLRDLSDLAVLANRTRMAWVIVHQAAQALRDAELVALATECGGRTERQIAWIRTRIKHVAPQALVVPAPTPLDEVRSAVPKRPSVAAMPAWSWAGPVGAAIVAAIGALALAAGQPWLLPSIGPSAYLAAENPAHPSARIYNTFVGHLAGIGAAILAVRMTGAVHAPATLIARRITAPRVWASAIALGLTLVLCMLLRASHPPAGATTLLFALGALKPTVNDVLLMVVAGGLVAVFAEAVRRVRLHGLLARAAVYKRKSVPLPQPRPAQRRTALPAS